MDKKEAYRVLDSVESALGTNAGRVHELANGDWCVIVRKGPYYLWSLQDWLDYCEAEGIEQVFVSQSGGGRVGLGAIDTHEVYQLVV